jgi:hypothetical protein
MRIKAASWFQVSKAGNQEGECDDRVQVSKYLERGKRVFRFAIADGATESAFSGLWAQALSEAYVQANRHKPMSPVDLENLVNQKARYWATEVWSRPLPWFAQEKVQKGAFSTLLGLYLEEQQNVSEDGFWNALGIGDSCLFQVRADRLITSFPIEQAEEFGYHPNLISTNPSSNNILWEQKERLVKQGNWQSGDRFLLMTDALAQWFLDEVEAGRSPWLNELAEYQFETPHQFQSWIDELRDNRLIRNDDVSLLMIRVEKQ